MKEFLNIIEIYPINFGSKIQKNLYEFIADSFSYIPQYTDNEAGGYWNCDKTLIIDVPDITARHFFSIERQAIVKIKTSDRQIYEIGTPNVPARVQISSNLNSANLIIKCKMLNDPFV